MTDLNDILNKNLLDDTCLHIAIVCRIPKLSLDIHDTRRMFLYGIGLNDEKGFTLNIRIDKESKKGKRVTRVLSALNFFADFKSFDEKRSTLYLKDFGRNVEILTSTIRDLVGHFKDGTEKPCDFIVKRMDATFRID